MAPGDGVVSVDQIPFRFEIFVSAGRGHGRRSAELVADVVGELNL